MHCKNSQLGLAWTLRRTEAVDGRGSGSQNILDQKSPAGLRGTFADHKSLPRDCGELLQTTKVSRGTAGNFCRPQKSPARVQGTFADQNGIAGKWNRNKN
jgi:hypothetical protein